MFELHHMPSSLLEIYRSAATGHSTEISQDLWGMIPSSFRMMKKLIKNRQDTINFNPFSDNIEILRNITEKRHRKLGTLTAEVKESLTQLDYGFLDVSHQPLFLGGPVFLINKVTLAEWIGKLLEIGTLFFIGDHDSIQNELTIARFPQSNSSAGLVITPETWGVPELTPMHQVPLPKEGWVKDIKVKIQENLRQLMKIARIRLEYRQLFLERFESWFDLIYRESIISDDFSSWVQRIWSQLFNIRNNLKLFLGPSSDLGYRQLILPAFEFLLTETIRSRYIKTLNSIYERLLSQKFKPGLPYREEDYVPFFLECLRCTNRTRVELHISKAGSMEGECPICAEKYSFSYNPSHPDLSEIGAQITPRSDSRAVVNNYTFPLLSHVGGAGETQYYSAVIPAMKRLKINPPILIRSNRVQYNSPWAEKSAIDNNSPILDDEVYNIFKEYNSSEDTQSCCISLEKMRNLIQLKYKMGIQRLIKQQEQLKNNPSDRRIRKDIKSTELMLSHNFGRFSPDKKNQEVTWNWLDLAVLTGINGICSIFNRQLKEEAFPGNMWYVTPGKFT
ncbi:MAG: hypothetical protein ACXACR_02845 [Candidatus Hodarchaeales archaeon]